MSMIFSEVVHKKIMTMYDSIDGDDGKKAEGTIHLPSLRVKYGIACCKGARDYMEDRFTIVNSLSGYLEALEKNSPVAPVSNENAIISDSPLPPDSMDVEAPVSEVSSTSSTPLQPAETHFKHASAPVDGAFFGIFDGHGGHLTSSYASWSFARHFVSSKSYPENISQALDDAVVETDRELLAVHGMRCRMDGSTCLTSVIENTTLWIANLGDSRAVLCRNGKAVAITTDHKPDESTERIRIERCGGVVRRSRLLSVPLGPFRVYKRCGMYDFQGGLALSRGLGDFFYKSEMLTGRREDDLVSSLPDMFRVDLDPATDSFCILASDGLWDVFSSDEAVRYVHGMLEESFSCYELAKSLMDAAIRRMSQDNITVTILMFSSASTKLDAGPPELELPPPIL